MERQSDKLKLVYITPALYMAGGVERVMTLKANYFVEHFEYDITIILTDGNDKPLFYPLSKKIHVINLDINFEELWDCSFLKKVIVYLKKQRRFKKQLTAELMKIHPDITISLLRREINFLNRIKDGSKKLGELHVNRANYRNFEANDTNFIKKAFEKYWMKSLVGHLKKLDRFIVLTHEDKSTWVELPRVTVIPDPLSFVPKGVSMLNEKRVIAVGRYAYQKGFDLLLQAWALVEERCQDWELVVFGAGDRSPYESQCMQLSLKHCQLKGSVQNIENEYIHSSLFVLSSRFEGFGMVLVEAMTCGLPVVSFSCPCGPKDIIRDEEDGLLAENGNVSDLAAKLLTLMEDDSMRKRMATAAIQNVQRFSMDNIAERWKTLFEEILQE